MLNIVRHFRSSRGTRSRGMAPVIQSFKKVINSGPSSLPVGLTAFTIAQGQDSVAAGQTGPSDGVVPTGCIIKYFEVQHAIGNGTAGAPAFIHTGIMQTNDGQSIVNPASVGGNPRRNQVFHQALFQLGTNQSNNRVYKFKVPKRFQRMREGTVWTFAINSDVICSNAIQVIYKFYR